ncbi:MAG TPA: short-chain fatty acyl-CoA regulator family protein [Stellaceae bacterium]|nr:short-chain fatty acyl-CoA regulator family protein [Stellaceae bacterium]
MALKKTLLGQKIRRLRTERKLSQQEMATRLGISPSYLNLIEHDERPVTVTLLLKLGKVFGVDLQELSDDDERRLAAALSEVFADSGLAAAELDAAEVRRLVAAAPKATRAIIGLYRAWRTAREDAQALQLDLPGGRKRRVVLPNEEARDFFEARANHFPDIETAAEALSRPGDGSVEDTGRALAERLAQKHGIALDIAPLERMNGALRRFEPQTRTLALSEVLPRSSRHFHLAYQLGLMEAREAIDGTIRAAKLASPESETLCRVGLANYFAGAVLMPYSPFLAAAQGARYDIELLMHRFGVSFEQAAHRLSTLQRPGEAGIPFFFARADIAGNVIKRFSAAGFHFSRFGGSCARFILHEVFATPGLIRTQIARLPDGATFFALARTVEKTGGGFHAPVSHHAVGMGCDIARAPELVYADGLDLKAGNGATEIGIGCRLCERADCRQRAFPPLQHRLVVDEMVKGVSTYAFRERR